MWTLVDLMVGDRVCVFERHLHHRSQKIQMAILNEDQFLLKKEVQILIVNIDSTEITNRFESERERDGERKKKTIPETIFMRMSWSISGPIKSKSVNFVF